MRFSLLTLLTTTTLLAVSAAHAQQRDSRPPAVMLVPTHEVLKLPTLAQVFPAECPLHAPPDGALAVFRTTLGTYTAYGNARELLPVTVEANILEGGGDRLTFGSRTTIRLPDRDVLDGMPYPVVPNMTRV